MAIRGVGRFVIAGVHGTVTFTGAVAVAATSNKMDSVNLRPEFSVVEHRDGKSAVFAATADEPVHRLTIRFTPISDVAANTLVTAKANITLPDRLAIVTLAGFARSNINGDWYFAGGGIDHEKGTPVGATMELIRFGPDPENPSITSAPADFE